MAMPMRSTDFASIVAPILNDAFDGVYDQRVDEYKQIFKVEDGIPRAYHEDVVLYGFGAAPELPDGMPVTYQSGGQQYVQRYPYKVYGLAFALTQVLIEDGDHIRIGTTFSKHLASSLIETKETRAANVLNRAFNSSFALGDGQALLSSSHPMASGVSSNLLTTPAAFSQTSLEQLIIQIRGATDFNGKKIRLTPKKLVVGPSNSMQAEVLLKSVLRTGTSNNDINPIKSMGYFDNEPVVLSRLTSPTAFFITTDAPMGPKVFMRRPMKKSMEGDFETDSIRYKATERYDLGVSNFRSVWGSQGA